MSIQANISEFLKNSLLMNPKYQGMLGAAAAATAVATASACSSWEPAKIMGTTVLTGIMYGIVNDMIACRRCIEYFTVGHFYDGRNLEHRPILTLDPNLNAIVWGTVATWWACAPAGAILATLSRVPLFGAPPVATKHLRPALASIAAATLYLSHIRPRPNIHYWNVPEALQAGWNDCNTRNETGYACIAFGSILLSVGIVATRIGLGLHSYFSRDSTEVHEQNPKVG